MSERLPIYALEEDILARARSGRRLILQAPTGSGKSTQTPQMLWRHGLLDSGQAVILQPRRLAARLLAARVAEECESALGKTVGYQIRFENVSGPETRIKYVTEGVLLRQMIQDPDLKGVRALFFDEFHERHLYGDITLARALELQETRRPDLLLLVMSATLDFRGLQEYLAPCDTLQSEGRSFPVEIEFHSGRVSSAPVWEAAADAFARHAETEGDALIFMPGSFEIQQTLEALRGRREARGRVLLPLHGELPPAAQDAAVARQAQPKIVVSTNVAETSLTIDGVRLVIDSGLARIPRYDPHRGINTLLIEKISRASSDQRAGRAGRTASGRCVRLWTREDHWQRRPHEMPEVKRLDLAEIVLTLKAAGVGDLKTFRWLEAPDEASLRRAEELLVDLGALDHEGRITAVGRKMLAFPIHPRYSRMMLAAEEFGCVYQAALVAALTQGRDLLLRKVGPEVEEERERLFGKNFTSDFQVLMRAWEQAAREGFRLDACRRIGIHALTARQVAPLLERFLQIARREKLSTDPKPVSDEALRKCILIGFSDRVGRRLDAGTLRCELVHGRRGVLTRESAVQSCSVLTAAEIREVEGKDKALNTLLSLATAIEPEWLAELFPSDVHSDLRVYYDPSIKRVAAEEQRRFRGLVLTSKRVEPPPEDLAAEILAREVFEGRLTLGRWNHAVEQWILRLNLLSEWRPDFELPKISDADRLGLLEQICHGAFSYKEIKDREVASTVRGWLSADQQALVEAHAPERLELSNGRRPKVVYAAGGAPYIALRIQELYGVSATPRVAQNRVPVAVHILAPNMRPVQITQDLESFWSERYPKIKQELQRKYPKHEWR